MKEMKIRKMFRNDMEPKEIENAILKSKL